MRLRILLKKHPQGKKLHSNQVPQSEIEVEVRWKRDASDVLHLDHLVNEDGENVGPGARPVLGVALGHVERLEEAGDMTHVDDSLKGGQGRDKTDSPLRWQRLSRCRQAGELGRNQLT